MTGSLGPVQEAVGDNYVVEGEIGRGGMAVVYRARDLRHNRHVAVKVLKEELLGSAHSERFLREVQLEGKLQHPHIIPIFDSGSKDGLFYFIMPLVEGESLRDRLDREGMLPWEEAVRIGKQVAEALAYAHGQGVVHRDIKPSNILLSDGHALISDFGVARALEETAGTRLTQTGIVVGTPAYMSPEQAGGEVKIDARSDIYSLGCTIHEMLGGEPPFSGATTQSVLAKHLHAKAPTLRIVRPELPDWLADLVLRMLAKVPADRLQTAQEVVTALDRGDRLGPSSTSSRIQAWIRPVLRSRKARGFFWVAGVAVGLLLFLYFRGPVVVGLEAKKLVCFPPTVVGSLQVQTQDVCQAIQKAIESAASMVFQDGRALLPPEQRENPNLISIRDARRVTIRESARYFVLPSVTAEADSLLVTLALYDARDGDWVRSSHGFGSLASASSGQIAARAMYPIFNELLDPGQQVDLDFIIDRDPGAVALWMDGERLYRTLQFDSAHQRLSEAVSEDSLLAWAALKGAQAASWAHRSAQAEDLTKLASRHTNLLPPKQAHFARGLAAFYVGQADSAVAHFQRALEVDPEWNEAWIGLGEVYYHLLPVKITIPGSAEGAFREAMRLNPGFLPPLIHLAEIELRRSEVSEADRLINQIAESGVDTLTLKTLQLASSCIQSPFSVARWEEAARTNPTPVLLAGKTLAAGGAHVDCAEGAFRGLLRVRPQVSGAADHLWGALIGLSGLLVARGQGEEAAELLGAEQASGSRVSGSTPWLYLLQATVAPELDALAQGIADIAPEVFGPGLENMDAPSGWSVAIWQAKNGSLDEVIRLSQGLDRLAQSNPGSFRRGQLALAVRGHLAALKGDTAAAIQAFSSLQTRDPYGDLQWGIREVLPYERLRLAELLLASGRYPQALEVAEVFDHPGPAIFYPFLARSLSVRSEAAEALGASQKAAEYRQRLALLTGR